MGAVFLVIRAGSRGLRCPRSLGAQLITEICAQNTAGNLEFKLESGSKIAMGAAGDTWSSEQGRHQKKVWCPKRPRRQADH